MVKYGSWDGSWRVPGIAPPSTHPVPTQSAPPRVHPRTGMLVATSAVPVPAVYSGRNSVVGLKSVGQLTLDARISGFGTMTEVYNLVKIGRINNHSSIPGTD